MTGPIKVGIVTSLLYFRSMLAESHHDIQTVIVLVYGFFTTLLFLMSTLYHFFEMLYRDEKKKPTLRYFLHISDRVTIYLFIAASYTPWLTLRKYSVEVVDATWATWTAALGGTLYQCSFHEKYKRVELVLYILIAATPAVIVFSMHDWSGLDQMALGGLIYVCGVVFFKLDGVVPFAHAIWHLHVLAELSSSLSGISINSGMWRGSSAILALLNLLVILAFPVLIPDGMNALSCLNGACANILEICLPQVLRCSFA